jgi:hypothetical protein
LVAGQRIDHYPLAGNTTIRLYSKKGPMKNKLPHLLFLACILLSRALPADEIRQLSWNDLIPAHLSSVDLMQNLDEDQKAMALWVINALENLPKQGTDNPTDYSEIEKAMPTLKDVGIDIAELMKKRDQLRTSTVAELNGQRVAIPGYLLPLEVAGDRVHEFLLVPYVGACIHVPPPPPNQIVHVKVATKKGYKNQGLFAPVWATGELSVRKMTKELYLVDGSADIPIGYAMKAIRIEPYK